MKHIATLLLLGLFGSMVAQQAPQYSLFALNPYAYNPAFAGTEGTLVATGVYRRQWSGLEGAPETQHLNVHLPVYIIHSGVGLKVENDQIGAHRTTQATASYNYQWDIGKQSQVSAGIGLGYLQYSLDGSRLRAPDGVYPVSGGISHNDPNLPEGTVKAGTMIGEAGIRAQISNLEIGAGIQPVFAPLLSTPAQDLKNAFSIKAVPHYLVHAAYLFSIRENLTMRPAVLLKSDFIRTQAEISAIFKWNNNLMAGASFRGFSKSNQESVSIIGGARLNEKTMIAYSFDIPLGLLSGIQRGSHELLLRYTLDRTLGQGKLPPVIYNPRFF
jgi:type IX secretion system PorP/SprF family membrane protein